MASITNDGKGTLVYRKESSEEDLLVRLYHDFERPRNGVEFRFAVGGALTGAQLWALLSEAYDEDRFTPHAYDGTAECFVPLTDACTKVFHAEQGSSLLSFRLDVKLVQRNRVVRARDLLCDSASTDLTGSWFGIGIVRGKTASNHGSLWRSALQFGASMTYTIGQRYEKKIEGSADIYKTYRQVPCIGYESVASFMNNAAVDAQIVVIEYGGEDLAQFQHPKRALYVLGSEDCGVPPALVSRAHKHVAIPTAAGRPSSLNVASAGAIVLYDRHVKMAHKAEKDIAKLAY